MLKFGSSLMRNMIVICLNRRSVLGCVTHNYCATDKQKRLGDDVLKKYEVLHFCYRLASV